MSTVEQDKLAHRHGYRDQPAITTPDGTYTQPAYTAYEMYSFDIYSGFTGCPDCGLLTLKDEYGWWECAWCGSYKTTREVFAIEF